MTTDELATWSVQAVSELSHRHLTVATAESLTAGMLAATIADVPGASSVLRGGLVVYATDLKATLAGVRDTTLRRYGPVAEETAAELAEGARKRCQADIGVGLTGVAGPTDQDGVCVGTVYLGVSTKTQATTVYELHLSGSRSEIRYESVRQALMRIVDAASSV